MNVVVTQFQVSFCSCAQSMNKTQNEHFTASRSSIKTSECFITAAVLKYVHYMLSGRSAAQPRVCAVWPQLFGKWKGRSGEGNWQCGQQHSAHYFNQKGHLLCQRWARMQRGDGVQQLNNAKARRSWCFGQLSSLCCCFCCICGVKRKETAEF